MVDFGMSRLNLTFGCDNKRSRTRLQEIGFLCYLLSHGIITIFRLILSLDYIEDYITQIKICQALFFLEQSQSTHWLSPILPDISYLLS